VNRVRHASVADADIVMELQHESLLLAFLNNNNNNNNNKSVKIILQQFL